MPYFGPFMNLLIFSIFLIIFFILERILHAFSFSVIYFTYRLLPEEKPRALLSLQVTSNILNVVLSIVSIALNTVLQCIAHLIQWILTMAVLITVVMILYILLQYSSLMIFEFYLTYNQTLGPTMQVLLVWPTRILTWLFNQLSPLYNTFVWFVSKVPKQILVETVTYNIGIVYKIMEAFGMTLLTTSLSFLAWVQSFVCCKDNNIENCNNQCLEMGERVFDFLTPMSHIRTLIVWVMEWLRQMCSIMTGPLDLLTFPFMDINFAKGLHFISNSVLGVVFHVPAITVERCNMFSSEGAIMCVPDFEPAINMLVAGIRYMGLFVDNWLDVLILIIEGSLGRESPKCSSVPDILKNFDFQETLFGRNKTVIVGLSEYLFAKSDGNSIQYFSLDRDWDTSFRPAAFPFSVNVNYGLAAISHFPYLDHDPKGDEITSLLGCSCSYGSVGIEVTCGVAMMNDLLTAESRIINVDFQLPSTAKFLSCDKILIRVESIRWPVTRYTSTRIQRIDGSYAQDISCSSKGNCVKVDAVIWIRPLCSVDGVDLVCINSFKEADCFPYCMGLHVKNSGSQRITMYSASTWNNGITLLKRDCALFGMTLNSTDPDATVYLPSSIFSELLGYGSTSMGCVENPQTMSRIPRSSFVEYNSHASVTLDNQPFLIANDLVFTVVTGQRDQNGKPTYSIRVQRIYGNQANEFTTISLNQYLPSMGPCQTPSDCENIDMQCQSETGCLPAIPYGYDHNNNAPVLGTTSQQFAYWVTNPSLEPFEAFSFWCKNRNRNYTNRLQISVLSSYGGIRLWRINPYIYCPVIDNVQQCPQDTNVLTKEVSSLNFLDFDESLCDETFNVMAVDLDYINEDNLALTVMVTTLTNIDIYTLNPINKETVTYKVLWVNPRTLEQREDRMWMPEAASPALTQGVLCPSQRRMPNVGSLIAEELNAVIHFLKIPLNVLMSFPIILDFAGGKCPLMKRGHSALTKCGSELLSMDDVFQSVYRGNALFWMTFTIIANSFGAGFPQTFINGVVMVLENKGMNVHSDMAEILGASGGVDPSVAKDIYFGEFKKSLPGPIQMAQLALVNPLAASEFFYKQGTRMLIQILQAAKQSRSIGNVFWNTVAEGATDYDNIVLQKMRKVCGGFSVMIGYNSPIGKVTHKWCNAFVEFQKGFLTLCTVFFVEVPLMDCVCVKSVGSNFATYLKQNCWSDTPDLMKPFISSLMYLEHSEACPILVKMTQLHFTEALDNTFSLMESGIMDFSSVIDSLMVFDPNKGNCNNFADNPYVMTLLPQPIDYFRVCGTTQTCRYKCLSEFSAFEAKNIELPITETVTENVQSLFFNSLDQDTYMPLTPLALIELYDCEYACGYVQTNGPNKDRCLLLGGENGVGQLEIISFCIPIQLGANVRRGRQSFIVQNLVPSALQTGFIFDYDPLNFWQSFKLLILTSSGIHTCHDVCTQIFDTSQQDIAMFRKFSILGNRIFVEASETTGNLKTFCFRFTTGYYSDLLPCETNIWNTNHHIVCKQTEINSCGEVLLIPSNSMESVLQCRLTGNNFDNCVEYQTQRNFVYKTSLNSAGLISQSAMIAEPAFWNVLMTAPADQISHWLMNAKIVLSSVTGADGDTSMGIQTDISINVIKQCSLENCVGCRDLALQRLCYAASQCQIARCIGTMVHLTRPLCSIGNNLASVMENVLSFVEGAWEIVAETIASVLAISGGIDPPSEIRWPDSAFFGYICSAKDVTASSISILTSSINGIVQSISETPLAQNSQSKITNQALMVFSMSLAATTNFLNQIALFPLYSLLATQKIFICSANSILSLVGDDKMSITIGDRKIKNMSKSTSKCMSEYFNEAGRSSDGPGAFTSGAVGELVQTVASLKMDFMIHPLDAALTWLSGLISGMQDVLAVMDRNRWVFLFVVIRVSRANVIRHC